MPYVGSIHDLALVRLRPRAERDHVAQNRTVLTIHRTTGFIDGDPHLGLFVDDTRLLSRYSYRINGRAPDPVNLSVIQTNTWLGYYTAPVIEPDGAPFGEQPEQVVELMLARAIGDGMLEEIRLTNFSQRTAKVELAIEVAADFADALEVEEEEIHSGETSSAWSEQDRVLTFRHRAINRFAHQGERGIAMLDRAAIVRVDSPESPVHFQGGALRFALALEPHQIWRADVQVTAEIDGEALDLRYRRPFAEVTDLDLARQDYEQRSAHCAFDGSHGLSSLVSAALDRARSDLASLRLHAFDTGVRSWTVAAGLPEFVSLFGRDPLTAGWQSAMLSTEILRGTLEVLPHYQGRERNDWREEQPGRLLHQIRKGPLSKLDVVPFGRHYATMTSAAFYPVALSELWHWTGDRSTVERLLPAALDAIRWLDRDGDLDGDGFYEYLSVSECPTKNQSWKDSDSAIVHADGSQAPAPIATAECQAFVYAAKLRTAELLFTLGREAEAREMFESARRLERRFNEVFWMEDEGWFALALDGEKRLVRSIASNTGHCLAAGIVDESRVERVVDRMFRADLFSGWGVRTLSSDHAAFNPYSYHRGTVWPAEQAAFALGCWRHGFRGHASVLCRALFEASAIFDYGRLPECFGGQPRDPEHPFPSLYPAANWPQAWSASAVVLALQAMLGLYPYAPLQLLLVDPALPEWLPAITLEDLRVGEAKVTIRFERKNGSSEYRVLDRTGRIHVSRKALPERVPVRGLGRLVALLKSATE